MGWKLNAGVSNLGEAEGIFGGENCASSNGEPMLYAARIFVILFENKN